MVINAKDKKMRWGPITTEQALRQLRDQLLPLIGEEISFLKIPREAALNFEPSQVGTIVGTLTDAVLPFIALSKQVGLSKGPGILGSREGYPDFFHQAGYRLELKGLFCDNPDVTLKKPPTRREPSARLTQKVTVKNVVPDTDALLVLSYTLEPSHTDPNLLTPVIKDLDVFPVIECVQARDHRLAAGGGIWFGDYQTPAILSKTGKQKIERGSRLTGSRMVGKRAKVRTITKIQTSASSSAFHICRSNLFWQGMAPTSPHVVLIRPLGRLLSSATKD